MKKYILLLLIGMLAFSCTDDFEELNTDSKNPSVIPAEPLFSGAARNFFDYFTDCSVNRNVWRLYAQYWAQTTYPEESQYNMVTRNIPDNIWNTMYRDVLKDLQEAKDVLNAIVDPNEQDAAIIKNKIAIIDIMEATVYTNLVDIFGDIPYSQALDADNTTPAYDDGKTVYYAEIDELAAALSALDPNVAGFDASDDVVYEGDIAGWMAYGHALHLKLAMRIADSDAAKARTMAEASADKVFTSDAGNFDITYYSSAPNTHQNWVNLVASGRSDYVGANTTIDIMNTLNDPRISTYYDEGPDGGYVGGVYGDANSYAEFSHLGSMIQAPDFTGTLMSYAEVEFLLAEAAARGYTVGGDTESHYNAGITASIMFWGGDQTMADDYLVQADVAYASAAGDWKQKVGMQKWLAMFDQGFEGWNTYRLFDFDGLNPLPTETTVSVPLRFIFPVNEATLNPSNYDAAAAKFGGDSKMSKIFWDMN